MNYDSKTNKQGQLIFDGHENHEQNKNTYDPIDLEYLEKKIDEEVKRFDMDSDSFEKSSDSFSFSPVLSDGSDGIMIDIKEAYGIVTVGVEKLEITETGAQIACFISSEKRNLIRLGTYVVIPYDDGENLFGRISKIEYQQEYFSDDATEIHSKRMIYGIGKERICEFDYKFLAFIEPVCILSEKHYSHGQSGTLQRRMADRIPRPNTPIFPVADRNMIQTGLNIPENGIFLGHLSVGGEIVQTTALPPYVPYYLRNDYSIGDPLIFRHMLVCGSTGTGKTFLTKNMLRQFMEQDNRYRLRRDHSVRKRPCLVIMDPQDEYCQMYEDGVSPNREEASLFESEKIASGGVSSTKTFLTAVSNQTYKGRSFADQVTFSIPFSYVESNPWILEMAELSEPQRIGLEKLLSDYFKQEKGVGATYKKFKSFAENPQNKEYYTGSGKIHESSYDAILRKVLISDFEKFFDQDASPIFDILSSIFKPGQISVFPTEYLSSSRLRDLIVLTIMSIIVDNKLNTSGNPDIKDTPIILALDEAHRYLSKEGGGVQAGRIVEKFAEAAKQGRKEGLGLFLITQDPQDIQPDILKQVNTKIILNLNNDAAVHSVKVPKEYEKRIPYLKKGQMIVYSPDNSDIVEITGLPLCLVKHE